MKQTIENVINQYEGGKRVNHMEVTTEFDRSDDMRSKANLELQAANIEQRREALMESYKTETDESAKEILLLKLDNENKKKEETLAQIDVFVGYLAGYDAE